MHEYRAIFAGKHCKIMEQSPLNNEILEGNIYFFPELGAKTNRLYYACLNKQGRVERTLISHPFPIKNINKLSKKEFESIQELMLKQDIVIFDRYTKNPFESFKKRLHTLYDASLSDADDPFSANYKTLKKVLERIFTMNKIETLDVFDVLLAANDDWALLKNEVVEQYSKLNEEYKYLGDHEKMSIYLSYCAVDYI